MRLQLANSNSTGILIVTETTQPKCDSQGHVNTEELNLSWNVHCSSERYELGSDVLQ